MVEAKARILSTNERKYWDENIQNFKYSHPLNDFGWGEVRTVDGWKNIYIAAEREGQFCGGLMLLIKKIQFTPFTIFYSPRGPVWDFEAKDVLKALVEKVKNIAREERSIFLRVDPSIPEADMKKERDILKTVGFSHLTQRWTFWNAPADVSRIDLTKFENIDEYHGLLHRDTRRCIRKASKEGVSIEKGKEIEELKTFYGIFKEFSYQKGFMSRGWEYQKKLWEELVSKNYGRLFLAKYQGEIIGGLICILFASRCLAMHMGTPYKYQKLQSSYAYVWESIKWAKERDCIWYSFRGVGTTPSQEFFKKKFKPEVIKLTGYYDLPFRKISYKIFYLCEFVVLPSAWKFLMAIRRFFHKLKKKIEIKQ
ncbi:lipid II:glycine glycyltransferase FemX [Thermodesulfobacteriota bacterium]